MACGASVTGGFAAFSGSVGLSEGINSRPSDGLNRCGAPVNGLGWDV